MELDTAHFTGRLAELLSPVRIVTLAAYIGLEQLEKKKQREGVDPRLGKKILIEEPIGELISVGDPYVQ